MNGFSRAGNTIGKVVPVSTLFSDNLPPTDMPPCTRAAFAESLCVYALAADGYQRLHYLDAPRADDPAHVRLRGFALTAAGT